MRFFNWCKVVKFNFLGVKIIIMFNCGKEMFTLMSVVVKRMFLDFLNFLIIFFLFLFCFEVV